MWKLKDEETARLFAHKMTARNDEVTKADDIQKKWLLMRLGSKLLNRCVE